MDYEDVLKLFDSDDEATFADDLQSARETTFLKFHLSGSTSVLAVSMEIVKLLTSSNIEVVGMYFKGPRGVLFEVVLNNSTKKWFIQLFEERNSGPLNASARRNIMNLCFGRFKLIINNCIAYLMIFTDLKCESFPCQSSIPQFGPCNYDIVNIIAGKLNDTTNEIISNFLSARSSGTLDELKSLIGLRLEKFEDSGSYYVRFLFNCQAISEDTLKVLNEIYGQVSFSSSTIHAIPKLLNEAIDAAIDAGRNISSLLPIIQKNDIILCVKNEMEVIRKGISQGVTTDGQTPVSSSQSRNLVPSTNHEFQNASESSDRSRIFDRLGSRIDSRNVNGNTASSSSQIARENITVTIRQNNLRDKKSGKKLKSVVVHPSRNSKR